MGKYLLRILTEAEYQPFPWRDLYALQSEDDQVVITYDKDALEYTMRNPTSWSVINKKWNVVIMILKSYLISREQTESN